MTVLLGRVWPDYMHLLFICEQVVTARYGRLENHPLHYALYVTVCVRVVLEQTIKGVMRG